MLFSSTSSSNKIPFPHAERHIGQWGMDTAPKATNERGYSGPGWLTKGAGRKKPASSYLQETLQQHSSWDEVFYSSNHHSHVDSAIFQIVARHRTATLVIANTPVVDIDTRCKQPSNDQEPSTEKWKNLFQGMDIRPQWIGKLRLQRLLWYWNVKLLMLLVHSNNQKNRKLEFPVVENLQRWLPQQSHAMVVKQLHFFFSWGGRGYDDGNTSWLADQQHANIEIASPMRLSSLST